MFRKIMKRMLLSSPMLFGATFIAFTIMQLAPGDLTDVLKLDPQYSAETIESIRVQYRLDKSIFEQYFFWLIGIIRLDFGMSFSYHTKVSSVIASRILNTFILSFVSIFMSWVISIPLGIFAAINKKKIIDKIIDFLSSVSIASPGFFMAIFVIVIFSKISNIPLSGMRSPFWHELSYFDKILDVAKHMIIPVLVLVISSCGILTKIMRANILEFMNKPFVNNLRARGFSETRIFFVHVLRNAINPMITIFGLQFSSVLSGSALVEIVCGWPGLGTVMLQAVRSQDIFLLMAGMLIGGVMLIVGNLMADILLEFLDPRIRR